jgi:ADP-heptose:LPS heptosyltransferase
MAAEAEIDCRHDYVLPEDMPMGPSSIPSACRRRYKNSTVPLHEPPPFPVQSPAPDADKTHLMRSLRALVWAFYERLSLTPLWIFARVVNPRPTAFSWPAVRTLLVIKLDEIGDFVLATPFLRELRRNAQQATVVLVVKPAVRNLAETCPYVSQLLVYDWQIASRHAFLSIWVRQWRVFRFAWTHLRRSHFEVALIPRLDADTYDATPMAIYAGAKAVVAYSESSTRPKGLVNRGFDQLVTHVVLPTETKRHEADAGLALIERFGGMVHSASLELWLTIDDLAFARANLRAGRAYVAFATGAAKPERCWPVERFMQLGAWLQAHHGFTPVLFGTHSDPCVRDMISFLGRTTLRQAAALMSDCTLFVGNDSGLKHIAAAVKTPVVEISAYRTGGDLAHPNSPARFHAWKIPQRVVQPPAGAGECAIEEVSVASVQAAIDELLRELGDRSAPNRS